jgi:short-subunit dehydrogenase
MQTIFITGATDGIGLALARLYAARSARLILVGRRPLSELDPAFFSVDNYVQADLSHGDASARIADFVASQGIDAIHVAIHNAGLGYVGEPALQTAENISALVSVNVEAPVLLTQILLPHLRRGQGKLVFVSSVVAAMATPDYAVYTATKAALDGFARNLRIELGDDVPILVIHAGATQTGMHRKAGADLERMKWTRFPTAEVVAEEMLKAIDGTRAEVTIGMSNRLLFGAGRLLGLWLDRLQVRMGR